MVLQRFIKMRDFLLFIFHSSILTEKSGQALWLVLRLSAYSRFLDAVRFVPCYCYPEELHLYFCKFYQTSSEEGNGL